MKEKLLVNRYDKRLNVSHRKKRTYYGRGSRRRCRAQVCRLAKLASRLILSLDVGVNQGLGGKQREQDRQGKSEHPDRVTSRVVAVSHLDFEATLAFSLTLGLFRSEHPASCRTHHKCA